MDYQKGMQELNKGSLSPIYLMAGSEVYLQENFVHRLLKQLGPDEELDISRFDLDEQTIDEVLDEADMFSFFSDYRVLIITNVKFLSAKGKQKLTDKQQKRLLDYIDQPNESSVLIFQMELDGIDKRRKLSKAFMKKTAYIDVSPLNEKQVERYIQTYLKDADFKMTREAVQELLMRTNFNLTLIMSEMNKLASFATTGSPVTINVVRQLVPRTLESDVFELTNAVVSLQIDQAIQIYQDLILMKHEPVALHALLISQFRLFIQTRLLAQKGFMEGDIAKQLSVHPYRVKLALQHNRQLTFTQLLTFYNELAEVDFQMKTGIGMKETYFYILITKLVDIGKQH